jgi:tripartite-type tricarboxylate transporter receptor subunit TctC
MRSLSRYGWIVAALAIAICSVDRACAEDAYPTRPISIIVPFPPGGANDLLARLVGDKMSQILRQPIVVENKAGAGGNIGSRFVAKAAPDGYTILLGFTGTLAINPAMYANVGFDPTKDLAPVGTIATAAGVLVVHPSVPIHSLQELIAYAKAKPDILNYASSGTGTVVHVSMEMLLEAAGIKIKHIPYRGTGPAVSDVLAGQVQMIMPPIPSVIGMIKAGQLRPIAVTSKIRSPLLPDVPTIGEAGLPGFVSDQLVGLAVPMATPRSVVGRLSSALNEALADPKVRTRIIEVGAIPKASTPEQYGKLIGEDQKRWGDIVKTLGLTAE